MCTDWEFTQAGLAAPWELPLGFEALMTYEALRLIDAWEREGRAGQPAAPAMSVSWRP